MYADRKVRDLKFAIGDQVPLKVSPTKGVMRFGKRGKLSPRVPGLIYFFDPWLSDSLASTRLSRVCFDCPHLARLTQKEVSFQWSNACEELPKAQGLIDYSPNFGITRGG
ncbi:uncharacterized protein LOC132639376 [Lycium barbarum]|uniref:uncharacterized protein LOC132639376 n=1 Tax=Lycium barbarum TaxID=112863 RepID=UPI00293F28C5|nr:uncharacterized protein LOC132639376 [Lycium barbarum]